MRQNKLREMVGRRDIKVGHFIVEFATPGIGHMVKNAGCDFIVFDMEHSGFDFETVKKLVRFAEAADLPAVVRTPSKDYDHIARACDAGAEGLMLPMVGSADDAKRILESIKYAPLGKRGVGLGLAHDNYSGGAVMEKLAAANTRTTVFLQIETAEGVRNADEIAALDGVDCLWIGHFDLTCSLGIPGQFDNPAFRDAVDTVVRACKKHNKSLGRLVGDVETGIALNRAGFDFISYSGDVWTFQAAVAAAVQGIRSGVGGGKSA